MTTQQTASITIKDNSIMLTATQHLHFGYLPAAEIAYLNSLGWSTDKIAHSLAGLRGQDEKGFPTESYIFPDLARERVQLCARRR